MSLYVKSLFRLVTTLLIVCCASMQVLAQGAPAQTTLAKLGNSDTLLDPLETVIYEPDFTEYLTWLDGEINTLGVPGVAMAVVSSTDTLDLRTWGVRSAGEDAPVDADTLFRIASVSKTFAGAVTAKLVHDRKQSWDTPIVSILPQYSIGTQDSSREMTLRHVLSHSTGLCLTPIRICWIPASPIRRSKKSLEKSQRYAHQGAAMAIRMLCSH